MSRPAIDAQCVGMFSLKAQIDIQHVEETAQQQPRTHKKEAGQRDLGNHKRRVRQAMVAVFSVAACRCSSVKCSGLFAPLS